MKKLLSTNGTIAISVIRVMLGIVLFAHGAQKLLGWFGGYGYTGTMGFLTGAVHLPYIIGLLVIVIEFFGALFLIAGFATRFAAAAIIILFTGIVYTSHWQNGFFMNWGGDQKGEGFEYHLLVMAIAIALLINGGGRFSVDKAIAG
ncbi:MAG TPA: DoxX family protein [Chitinophagaceae bacterium]|jgi:putative oxidoreductase|nr:DoxX family protein [Chitinophagaceae bacterium]